MSSKKIIFDPFPKQQEFIEAVFSGRYSFLCYGGAMGGGKTYVCLIALIMLCKAYPGSKWCIIRDSLPTLKRTTIASFKRLVPSRFVASYNQQDQVYTFNNESQIFFLAEDYANDKEFDRFKGLEVNGFLLEQIEELQKPLLDICFVRAGRHKIEKMPRPMILANVNPTLTWPKEHVYERHLNNTLPSDWYYEPAKISDNPVLFNDQVYMHNVTAHLDPITKARMIDGDWNAFAIDKPFFYNFSIGKHQVAFYNPNPHLPILISFDFNVDPMTAVVSQRLNVMDTFTFDEFKIGSGSVEEMCHQIKARYPGWIGNMQVTGDATGRSREKVRIGNITAYKMITQELGIRERDLLTPTSNMALKDSRTLTASVMHHSGWRITKNCKETISQCVNTEVDEYGDPVKKAGHTQDLFDNVRYTLHTLYPDFISNPSKYRL